MGAGTKVAVTLRLAVIVTLQPPPPEQSPSHSLNTQPVSGFFESETVVTPSPVREGYLAEQVLGQLMPAGELVTVPDPVILTVRVNVGAACCGPAAALGPSASTVTTAKRRVRRMRVAGR